MSFRHISIVSLAIILGIGSVAIHPSVHAEDGEDEPSRIRLLEPLIEPDIGPDSNIENDGGKYYLKLTDQLAIVTYFNSAIEWVFSVAVGITVFWGVFGSFDVMTSGSDSSKRSEGFERIKWSIIGLVVLIFSGAILRLLNPLFFN